jgi:hypothetical protein
LSPNPEIILNEYSKNTENALFEWLGKETTSYFTSTDGFFGFKCSFENCLWNLFITFGLSQICKIKNVWKLSSPFLMKTSFWKKNCPINSKTVIKKFFYLRLPCKSLIFTTVLGYSCKKIFESMGSEYSLRRDLEVSRHFLLYRFEINQMC